MSRRLTPGRLVMATHNSGKVREIGDLLRPFGMEMVAAGDLGLPIELERVALHPRGEFGKPNR